MYTEQKALNPNEGHLRMEADVAADASVSATRGQGVTCVKSGTATYTFTVKGNNHGQKMYAILDRKVSISGTPATITNAIITSVSQNNTTDDITIVVKTTIANYTETATTGACTLSVAVVMQTNRMTNPFD